MEKMITIPADKLGAIAELLLVAAKSPSVNVDGMRFALNVIAEWQQLAAQTPAENPPQAS